MKKIILIFFCTLVIISISYINTIFAYTEKEYRIYQEANELLGSIPVDQILEQLGQKYNMTPAEIDATFQRVTTEIRSGMTDASNRRKKQIRTAVERLAKIKGLIVVGEFASVVYIEQSTVWNDDDVKRKVLAHMPKILGAVFSVPGIDRVRLIAYYPAEGGGEMKVASLEAYRSEFKPKKRPAEYSKFWVR